MIDSILCLTENMRNKESRTSLPNPIPEPGKPAPVAAKN
jgi:hypothetical protein